MRIVFMGSPAFAVPSLQALVAAGHEITLVVTQPDRPAGRGGKVSPPPVKAAALELGLDIFQPETLKDPIARERLAAPGADVFVVAAYGKILSKAVLSIPRLGCVNVHASLLPRWRGASPITAAILAGDADTGVSIMEMSPGMDEGPVFATAALPLAGTETAGTLEPVLARLGAETLVSALPRWASGELRATPQDAAAATYCWTLQKDSGHLAASMTAAEAERAVRAYNPWPGASVLYREERLAIWKAHVVSVDHAAAGAFTRTGRLPAVAFRDGLLVLDEVQRPGGKRLPGGAFLNGERGAFPATVGLA